MRRRTPRPNQNPNSVKYEVKCYIKGLDFDQRLTAAEIEKRLSRTLGPIPRGTISSACSDHYYRGEVLRSSETPFRYFGEGGSSRDFLEYAGAALVTEPTPPMNPLEGGPTVVENIPFVGLCVRCGEEIPEGTLAVHLPGRGMVHSECPGVTHPKLLRERAEGTSAQLLAEATLKEVEARLSELEAQTKEAQTRLEALQAVLQGWGEEIEGLQGLRSALRAYFGDPPIP
jgi:hypothetical protein